MCSLGSRYNNHFFFITCHFFFWGGGFIICVTFGIVFFSENAHEELQNIGLWVLLGLFTFSLLFVSLLVLFFSENAHEELQNIGLWVLLGLFIFSLLFVSLLVFFFSENAHEELQNIGLWVLLGLFTFLIIEKLFAHPEEPSPHTDNVSKLDRLILIKISSITCVIFLINGSTDGSLMLAHRLRRWANIRPPSVWY